MVRIGTAVLLALVGLGMAIPGAKLLSLGGSAYYLVAGVVILAAAVLLFLRRRSGVYLYGLVLLATLAWGLFEVGLDGWGLMPRLVFLCVFGLWLALPLVWRDTEKPGPKAARALKVAAVVACLALAGSGTFAVATHSPRSYAKTFAEPAAATAPGAESGEWTHYGAVLGGGRSSALGQITPANAGDLSDKAISRIGAAVNAWTVKPVGSEGYRTAEVTLGGVDTNTLDSKTMQAKAVPGLYFIGEVVDVTGWLGGYNFQWAWSSGWVAGQAV